MKTQMDDYQREHRCDGVPAMPFRGDPHNPTVRAMCEAGCAHRDGCDIFARCSEYAAALVWGE